MSKNDKTNDIDLGYLNGHIVDSLSKYEYMQEALASFLNWYEKNKPFPYEENGIDLIAYHAKIALDRNA